MIDRYAMFDIQKLTDRFSLPSGVPKGVRPLYGIRPTNLAPVVVRESSGNEVRKMSFGLMPKNAKDTSPVFRYKTHTVRSEKVFAKASWDAAIRHTRCIIPANGFYMQHQTEDGLETYYFESKDSTLLSVAGIYTKIPSGDGSLAESFAMLTIEANDTMPPPFRVMPVLLHSQDEEVWLSAESNDRSALVASMRPFEGPTLNYRRVSSEPSVLKLDSPQLIEPVE